MGKYFSFIAIDVRPLSQNSRPSNELKNFGLQLVKAHNLKYPSNPMPFSSPLVLPLEAKVFYLHKIPDKFDADNISKPLWDAFQGYAYTNDHIIKYLETLKIDLNTTEDSIELDVTNIDENDFKILFDFIFENPQKKERLLYIMVSDYQSKNITFL